MRKLFSTRAFVFPIESPAKKLDKEDAKTLASFALIQWTRLDWPLPEAIIPMPDSFAFADEFAKLLQLPVTLALTFDCEYKKQRLKEDQILLLLDLSSPLDLLQKAETSISKSFPKRVYILNLYQSWVV